VAPCADRPRCIIFLVHFVLISDVRMQLEAVLSRLARSESIEDPRDLLSLLDVPYFLAAP